MNYKTPGVYIEELSLFPPSVAQVETAIPAFIGYTQFAKDDEDNTVTTFPYIKRIKSLLEYEQYFGTTIPQAFDVRVENDEPVGLTGFTAKKYQMYYALQMFYANGGGPCYIVSVEDQTSLETITLGDITAGLDALKKKDEPTLLLFPDAVNLGAIGDFNTVMQSALTQCKELGDRFTIMDIYNGSANADADITAFRTGVGSNFLNYGAAYTPWLNTNINYEYTAGSVTFDAPVGAPNSNNNLNNQNLADVKALIVADEYQKIVVAEKAKADATAVDAEAIQAANAAAEAAMIAAIAVLEAFTLKGAVSPAIDDAEDAVTDATAALTAAQAATDVATAQASAVLSLAAANDAIAASPLNIADLAAITTIFTNEFEAALERLLGQQYLTMPPASAMAGIYAMVDRTRGVWKAPANVSVSRVLSPTAKITDADQESLNVDSNGKSINAIRSFTGKGIIVWGARTLMGNDNEWRYISVRRFFNMAEESIKEASENFVFEPNDANTWVKVRAMIENFLTLQWRAGALAGATPEDAFYVKVGLGKTMTAVDILEGRMNVEIGMAVVRPAEFIILKFSHKMQES